MGRTVSTGVQLVALVTNVPASAPPTCELIVPHPVMVGLVPAMMMAPVNVALEAVIGASAESSAKRTAIDVVDLFRDGNDEVVPPNCNLEKSDTAALDNSITPSLGAFIVLLPAHNNLAPAKACTLLPETILFAEVTMPASFTSN